MDSSTARILDANANRAREALRVMEDYARFGLDDPWLAKQLKSMRHDLAASLDHRSLNRIIRARDVEADVGRDIRTASEYRRTDARDGVTAAAKRATEALRSLEEYAKTIPRAPAGEFERLRYRLYELDRALAIRIDARQRLADLRLYVLLTGAWCSTDWHTAARRAIDGGADCIQLREKNLTDRRFLDRARSVAALCRDAGVLFIVNDRPDIARLSGAQGVHLGQDDFNISDARRIAGPALIVGVSTHSIEQVRTAAAQSPDYIAVGPMFPSPTKPQQSIPGPELLTVALTETSLPLLPIGGINPETIDTLLSAGATRVCVCAAVVAQPDIVEAARTLRRRVTQQADSAGPSASTTQHP